MLGFHSSLSIEARYEYHASLGLGVSVVRLGGTQLVVGSTLLTSDKGRDRTRQRSDGRRGERRSFGVVVTIQEGDQKGTRIMGTMHVVTRSA